MTAGLTRRQFLGTSSTGAAGLAWLASGQAPAFAQKRELEWAQEQIARALKGQLKVG